MPDFWLHSGFHLTEPDENGERLVTDDLLRAFCARPELAPVEESCANERALFASLQENPRGSVAGARIDSLADADARDNYRVFLRFRDLLMRAGSIERAYSALFVAADGSALDFSSHGLPPLFAEQLAHIAVRAAIEPCDDPLVARAAELFFRDQRANIDEGRVLLADQETVEMSTRPDDGRYGNLGRLIAEAQTPLKRVELDVLSEANGATYWARDERHDTVLAIHFGQPGLKALCRVIAAWVLRFHGVATSITPVRAVERARLRWFTGLDRHSTRILNALYNGESTAHGGTSEEGQLLALLELRVQDGEASSMRAGDSCFLGVAMDEDRVVRLKPQNLLLNLPFRRNA
ncbi:MAG: hypothetical protein JNM79_10130 [Burkholderiales bacterium]|nr:hypothetical protein [Burkholderiales bacterium]